MAVLKVDIKEHTLDTLMKLSRATGKTVDELVDIAVDLSVQYFMEEKEVLE